MLAGNNHASAGNFVAHQFGRQLFLVGDERHFFGDDALAGVVHLRKLPVAFSFLRRASHSARGWGTLCSVAAVAVSFAITIRGSHDRQPLEIW
jgi:hypothetical protein